MLLNVGVVMGVMSVEDVFYASNAYSGCAHGCLYTDVCLCGSISFDPLTVMSFACSKAN